MVFAHVYFSPSGLSWTRVGTHLGLFRAVLDPKLEPKLVQQFKTKGLILGPFLGFALGGLGNNFWVAATAQGGNGPRTFALGVPRGGLARAD